MNFDSTNASATGDKKGFNDLAMDFYPYWKPLFESLGEMNPVFKSKLAYNSKEFTEGKIPGVRFFESELNSEDDVYIECVDWDRNYYDPMNRTLYKLSANPHWKGEPDKYVRSSNSKHVSFAVRLSDLEIVNKTSITETSARIASIPATPVVEMEDEEADFAKLYEGKDDNHISSITIRDQYCITHNVPLSNKDWLNDLIIKGREWLKTNQKA
jgi:hypothetical protein